MFLRTWEEHDSLIPLADTKALTNMQSSGGGRGYHVVSGLASPKRTANIGAVANAKALEKAQVLGKVHEPVQAEPQSAAFITQNLL